MVDDMNLLLIFSFMLFGKPDISFSRKTTKYTIPIEQRVAILKQKIANQIKDKTIITDASEVTVINEEVEYEDKDDEPLTPIDERDPRKKKELYKLRALKTTPGIKKNYNDFDFDVPERNFAKRGKVERMASKKVVANRTLLKTKKSKKPKITDVFYRRALKDIGAHQWTHCQSLITPYILGQKTNITVLKSVSYDDVTVIRLVQLLTEDITGHSKDDIHSILYQISNLQLRLFQWDVAAIKLLLNVINSSKMKSTQRHTFKAIKYGLKEIFKTWKLNFGSNISLLMKQTRLFRPPCVVVAHFGGSTKTSKTVRYTKATTKKRCHKKDKNYEECIRKEEITQ